MAGMTHRLLRIAKLRVLALAVLVVPLALVSTTQVSHAIPPPGNSTVEVTGPCDNATATFSWSGFHGGNVTAVIFVVGSSGGPTEYLFPGQNGREGSVTKTGLSFSTGNWSVSGDLTTPSGRPIRNTAPINSVTIPC